MEELRVMPRVNQSVLMYLADDFRTLVYFTNDSLLLEDVYSGESFEYNFKNGILQGEISKLLDCIDNITVGHISSFKSGKKELNLLVTLNNSNLKTLNDANGLCEIPEKEKHELQNFTYFLIRLRFSYSSDH